MRGLAALAFALWGLAGCSSFLGYDDLDFKTQNDPSSTALCQQSGAECGEVADDNGAIVDCGECREGLTCGGAGPNLCGSEPCKASSCASIGQSCGKVSNGCGAVLDCGPCGAADASGYDASKPDTGKDSSMEAHAQTDTQAPVESCAPKTCEQLAAQCGDMDDGCGTLLSCPACVDSQTCNESHKCVASGSGEHVETETDPNATGSEPQGLLPICCTPSAKEKALVEGAFALLNAYREQNGLNPLIYDTALESAVEAHCHHMAIHPFGPSHFSPESVVADPGVRAQACGAPPAGGEILNNVSGDDPSASMAAFKQSSTHNQNMLKPSHTRVGIGTYPGGPYGRFWGHLYSDD